ncbi:MAG: isochorismatase family protein [Bacteroidetes bacterium]|nr:isochorismatase family protein [Bacteroidota bacterium]
MKTALLIVDVQNDFCPGGALPTPQGDIIVPVINKLMEKFSLIIASRDWHPEDTIHFNHWPVHCVKESHGADFPADLKRENIIQIFKKGTGSKDDGYSAFEATNKNLGGYFKEKEVDELYITGLTAEYCVKSTVLDSLKYGFKTFVIKDAIEGIRQNEDDFENAFEEMKNAGATIITSDDIHV